MVYPYCNVLHSKYERKLKFLAPDKKYFLQSAFGDLRCFRWQHFSWLNKLKG
ncbi:hypothetical protein Plhal304r1_c026g0088671 [Plasmopara halstedii]